MKALLLGLALMGAPDNHNAPKESELYCLAHVVYHEARGEPLVGQEAVAHVLLNRARDSKKALCEEAYAPQQFTDIKKTVPNTRSPAWLNAIRVALTTINGASPDPTEGAKWFYAPKVVSKPRWAKGMPVQKKIGNHIFLAENTALTDK